MQRHGEEWIDGWIRRPMRVVTPEMFIGRAGNLGASGDPHLHIPTPGTGRARDSIEHTK
jgi:hypothetical protein